MIKLNEDILKIEDQNEFFTASKYVREYKANNPDKKVISLGIGDVSKPIAKPVIDAMHNAVDELASMKTFKGYGPSHGYDFLKDAILKNEYSKYSFSRDEIYISNGTKTDSCSILELFDKEMKICAVSPIYPIYKNGAACLNRKIEFLKATEENDFLVDIPKEHYDLIYLCSPNNPIGIAYSFDYLNKWVDYALNNNAIILFDNAYYAFIQSNDVPKSIYEIKNAKKVSIEFRSFSKSNSYTGVRCSYFVIPNEIYSDINEVWKKRTINRFNGADYIAQKGAEASYLPESQKEIKENIHDYMNHVKILKAFFNEHGFKVFGGDDSPFLWVKLRDGESSWEIFHKYLEKLNVVVTPGIIFGKDGDNYIRISGLASEETIIEAMERLRGYYEK